MGRQAVTKNDFTSLANFLAGKDAVRRVHKKDPHGPALRAAAEMYDNHEYVTAYECFQPVYDHVVSSMQRVLARNPEIEAKEIARKLGKPLSVAKENVRQMKAHAQQVLDQLERLRQDLESKPLVRIHLKKGKTHKAPAPPAQAESPTVMQSAAETRLDTKTPAQSDQFLSGDER